MFGLDVATRLCVFFLDVFVVLNAPVIGFHFVYYCYCYSSMDQTFNCVHICLVFCDSIFLGIIGLRMSGSVSTGRPHVWKHPTPT
jgi:hypothetical protein